MRMSELSTRSGVATPSIKFYQRERLLPEAARTSPNQATYDESHVHRLKLVRALIEVGGLSVSSVRDVLAAIDDEAMPLTWAFGVAQHAVSQPVEPSDEPTDGSRAIDALVETRGWTVEAGGPGQRMAARVYDTYARLGQEQLLAVIPSYADAAEIVAAADLATVAAVSDRADMVQTVVMGTVMGDALFAGLRRIAQENASNSLFPAGPES